METQKTEETERKLEGLSTDELEDLHGYLLEQHRVVTDEIGVVESALFSRHHDQLPLGQLAVREALD